MKKRVLFEKVMDSLEKWNAEPILIRKDSLMIEFNFHDWVDVWSYTIENNKVKCHKNAAHYIKSTRSYEVDNELLQRIENYLLC